MKITLKAARVNAGIKQGDAAKLLGITPQTLYNYETENTYPDSNIILKMVTLYSVKYDNIIFLNSKSNLIGGD